MSVRLHAVSTEVTVEDGAPEDDFLALYGEHARPLLAWLSSRVARSDLDDVHQEIWTKVWAKKRQSFTGGNFRAWLFTVARNHLYDRHEKKPATPLLADPEEPRIDHEQPTPCTVVIDRERRERLQRCMGRLPEVRRRIVEARLAGQDYDSIAAELGISANQAHSHFFAAKRQLQEWLQEA